MSESNLWQSSDAAASWDAGGGRQLATRVEQLEILLELLADIPRGAVLDLGIGSGLVAEQVLKALPKVELVGVDFSPPMLALASDRLRRFGSRVHLCVGDLSNPSGIDLPRPRYAAVFSVQTLHHLDEAEKAAAFNWIAGLLEPSGLLVVIDRVNFDEALFRDWRVVWRRVDAAATATYADYRVSLEEGGDRPSSLEDHIRWMQEAGLVASCFHAYGDRVVLVGRKLP